MKQTLFWKQFDLIGQLVMALPVICIVSPESRGYILLAYFGVGGWQGISCLLWALSRQGVRNERRAAIGYVFAGIPGLFLLCQLLSGAGLLGPFARFFTGIAAIETLVMLFLGPILAIWYAVITLEEIRTLTRTLKHRSELQWRQV